MEKFANVENVANATDSAVPATGGLALVVSNFGLHALRSGAMHQFGRGLQFDGGHMCPAMKVLLSRGKNLNSNLSTLRRLRSIRGAVEGSARMKQTMHCIKVFQHEMIHNSVLPRVSHAFLRVIHVLSSSSGAYVRPTNCTADECVRQTGG